MQVENPFEYIGKLDNAGSVFLGHYSSESLGDYYAGPNHVYQQVEQQDFSHLFQFQVL